MKLHSCKKLAALVISVTICLVCSGIAQAGIPTEVIVNKSVLLTLKKPLERIAIANPAIADAVTVPPHQVLIQGIKEGSTTLIVWEKGNPKQSFFDVNVVSGKSNEQVLLQVKVAQVDKTALKKMGVSFAVKNINAEGMFNGIGAPTGGIGTTASGTTTTYSGSSTVSTLAGGLPALGGFNPLDNYTMGITHFPSGISAVLKLLSTKNLAKILAEPNLVVKSGHKGDFLAGSRIPYPIVTSTGGTAVSSIIFMNVGVKLNFSPEVMENGVINLKIDPAEVSSLSGSYVSGTNPYPIIDTREIRTSVELRDGESLVLGGLLSEETVKTLSKVPWLGDIPILGALFRSSTSELKERELVFFITPKLVKPLAPGSKVELPTDKPLTPEQEKELQWIPTTLPSFK